MPNANPLFDDIGIQAAPAPAPTPQDSSSNPLFSDLGISRGGTDYTEPEDKDTKLPSDDHPVTSEFAELGKHALRSTIKGIGDIGDLPGLLAQGSAQGTENVGDMNRASGGATGSYNKDSDYHPIAHLVAEKLADRLQQAVPALAPQSNTPLTRVVDSSFEALPTAALTGPESIVPTMMSGASSQIAKEAGAGPGLQFAAGLAPFAPSIASATARGLVRGNSGAEMADNLATAKNAGIDISPGQAANNPALRAVETGAAKLPGGSPVMRDTRNIGGQAEQTVSNITKNLSPNATPTPTTAGEAVQAGVDKKIVNLNQETSDAKEAMNAAVGKDRPMSAPKFEASLKGVINTTGIPEIDALVNGSKTKAIAKTADAISNQPKVPTSYSSDGEGYHVATSPNGETHAVETATGDLKVTRSDTNEAARGQGEGTARLDSLAQVATSKGKNLVSDISVSPAESAAYEKLGRQGWQVTKNPNAEIDPATGNTISDSPKNPVYTVKAPSTTGTGEAVAQGGAEKQLTGEWTYNPTTGKSEPVTTAPNTAGPNQEGQSAVLNQATPYTFDGLRTLRTNIGQSINTVRNPFQKAQLKQLYGALSNDLADGARQVGPEAEAAYGLFNSVAKQNAGTQKTLTRAVSKIGGPEAVFKAAVNGSKDGATKVEPIFNALDDEGKNTFRATVLHRLGRTGGAVDAPFDANTFLTNWRSMSPEAKDVLFKSGKDATGQLRGSLDSLSKTLDLAKAQGYLQSNLGKTVSQAAHAGGGNVLKIMAYGWMGEHGLGMMGHLAKGEPLLAAGAGALGVGAMATGPILSRVLTNPKVTSWLAQATKAPNGMIPSLLTQLTRIGDKDQDAKDLADLIGKGLSQSSMNIGQGSKDTGIVPKPPTSGGTIYPKINRAAGMQPLPGGGYGIPPETM